MIDIRNISYPAVFDRLSLHVAKGERLVLCGPSGAGKTTLLRCIAGLTSLEKGEIRLDERLVTDGPKVLIPPHERHLGMVFQDLGLWPHLSVLENVALGVPAASRSRERRLIAKAQLEQCLLQGFEHHRLGHLSGGELTRVAVARALVASPQVLLLDEAFTGLDINLQHELGALITSTAEAKGTTIVAVFHDVISANHLSPHRVVCLESGTIRADHLWSKMLGAHEANPFFRAWLSACRGVTTAAH